MIALSYSRLSTYLQCPRKFKLQFLDKAFPNDGDNPYFVRGSNIHKQLEDYANARIRQKQIPTVTMPDLSEECIAPSHMVDNIVNNFQHVYAEQQVSVDKNWNQVDWFSKATVYRVIYDLLAYDDHGDHMIMIDWKTGKVRAYDNSEFGQLRLAACIAMALKPHINVVTTAYIFVDHKKTISVDFHRGEHEAMISSFVKAHKTVNDDDIFEPKVNQYCKWCAATHDQCEYASKKGF